MEKTPLLARPMRIGASFPAAIVAGVGVVIVTGPLLMVRRPWVPEAAIGGAAAAAWMLAGLKVAGRDSARLAPLLFLLGSLAAWYFARGMVHTHSAQYGLFTFAMACVGGMVAWSREVRHESKTWRASALLVPIATLIGAWSVALANPQTGFRLNVRAPDSTMRRLPVVHRTRPVRGMVIWSSRDVDLAAGGDRIGIELDPGSGAALFPFTEARGADQIRAACEAFAAAANSAFDSEVRDGMTPPFMKIVPMRWSHCARARLWIAGY